MELCCWMVQSLSSLASLLDDHAPSSWTLSQSEGALSAFSQPKRGAGNHHVKASNEKKPIWWLFRQECKRLEITVEALGRVKICDHSRFRSSNFCCKYGYRPTSAQFWSWTRQAATLGESPLSKSHCIHTDLLMSNTANQSHLS